MRRRRLFALAGGASAVVALPAVAAPVVEMHANDVTPLDPCPWRPLSPSEVNDLLREHQKTMRVWFSNQRVERVEWIPVSEPVIWRWRNG